MGINTVLLKEPLLQSHELPVKRFLLPIMEMMCKIFTKINKYKKRVKMATYNGTRVDIIRSGLVILRLQDDSGVIIYSIQEDRQTGCDVTTRASTSL